MDSIIASQIDIMPTVLGKLGYSKKFVSFGRDLFGSSIEPRTWNVTDDVYNFYQGDFVLRFDGAKPIGLFNFKTDEMLTANLLTQRPELASQMETSIKAIIQQYNNRMIDKKFTTSLTAPLQKERGNWYSKWFTEFAKVNPSIEIND